MSTEGSFGRPGRPPDHRAVFGTRGLVVSAWSATLRWSELYVAPLDSGALFVGPRNQTVFEVWEGPEGILAREIVAERTSSEEARRQLEDWGRVRGLQLEFGPMLPDFRPSPRPLRIAFRPTEETPAFRFVIEPGDGRATVYPWGKGAEVAGRELPEAWEGAIGDIFALDRDRASACFASVSPRFRSEAERMLRSWAERDDWKLEVAEGQVALARPRRRGVAESRTGTCTDCGDAVGYGFASAISFRHQRFHRTRCDGRTPYLGPRLTTGGDVKREGRLSPERPSRSKRARHFCHLRDHAVETAQMRLDRVHDAVRAPPTESRL